MFTLGKVSLLSRYQLVHLLILNILLSLFCLILLTLKRYYHGKDEKANRKSILLESGDALVFGGPARLISCYLASSFTFYSKFRYYIHYLFASLV